MKCGSEKKSVTFSHFTKYYLQEDICWNEYRKPFWIYCVSDRLRFNARVQNMEKLLSPILRRQLRGQNDKYRASRC